MKDEYFNITGLPITLDKSKPLLYLEPVLNKYKVPVEVIVGEGLYKVLGVYYDNINNR